jgi:hypothetical protein
MPFTKGNKVSPGAKPVYDRDHILRLRGLGLSHGQIRARTGISKAMLSKLLKGKGLTPPPVAEAD